MELDYSTDILNDEIFRDIKNMSLSYLFGETNVLDIDDEHLDISLNFIDKKYNEILDLKNAMKLKYYASPFREISESMDKITLTNQLTKSEEPHILVLTKDISYILDDLLTQRGILSKMYQEKIDLIEDIRELASF